MVFTAKFEGGNVELAVNTVHILTSKLSVILSLWNYDFWVWQFQNAFLSTHPGIMISVGTPLPALFCLKTRN